MKRARLSIFFVLIALLLVIKIQLNDKTDSQETVTQTDEKNHPAQTTTTTENNPFINLSFNPDIQIDQIKPYQNEYIAMGTENDSPYLQMIHVQNNSIIKGTPYLFNTLNGNITDITQHDYYLTATIKENNTTTTQDFIVNNDQFILFYKKQLRYNYYKGMTIHPKYIVIHETANYAVGANAKGHYDYWNNDPNADASTHFVVDNTQIYQMLKLNQAAWHVGDNHGYSDITNFNSIGIEICVNSDGNYIEARENAIELTIQIMKDLHMNISQLKRHFDASGKDCPQTMIDNPSIWTDFVNQVENGLNS